MGRTLTRATQLLALVLTLVSAVFWSLLVQQRVLMTRMQHRNVQRTFPVNGLKVRFDVGVEKAPIRPLEAGRRLLLVASDDCPALPAALPIWKRLVSQLSFAKHDSVILVTRGTHVADEIQAAAEAAHVPITIVQKDASAVWASTTGLSATPTTVTLDESDRVRLIGQILDEREQQLFKEFFAAPEP